MDEPEKRYYRPTPTDTSDVRLTREQSEMIEAIARNIHDLWASRRRSEGWRWGPQRDDRNKTHPGIVPFDALEPTEKEYDRMVAAETIKLLVKMGFAVSKQ